MLNLLNPSRFAAAGPPPMGFPQTVAPTVSTFGSSASSRAVTMPPAVSAGDLLLAILSVLYLNPSVSTGSAAPAGWSKIHESKEVAGSLLGVHLAVHARVADGSEDGGTVSFDLLAASRSAAAQCYRITNWFGSVAGVEAAGGVSGGSANTVPNPPSLTTSWGAADTLWIAAASAADDDASFNSAPSNFIGLTSTLSGGGTNAGTSLGTARRELNAAALDPGNFVLSESERWRANTIAIRPGL